MIKFVIVETNTFISKIKKHIFKNLYPKIKNYIYPQLRENPYFGPNIKKLKGKYKDFYRYRIGNHRLFYKIDNEKIIIFIVDIFQRKDSYKK